MTDAAARRFLEQVEYDEVFANELEEIKGHPDAVLRRIRAAGFDVTQAEVRDAFLDRYGAQLSPDQLASLAAGAQEDTAILAVEIAGGVATAAAITAAAIAGVS